MCESKCTSDQWALGELIDDGEPALIRAAEAADRDEVRRLLAAGADARAESLSGWTALHGAAESGSVAVVSLLAEAGCDVSAVAGSGKTPLDIARQYNRAAAARAHMHHLVLSCRLCK